MDKNIKVFHYIVVGDSGNLKSELVDKIIEVVNIEPGQWQPTPANFDPLSKLQEITAEFEDYYIYTTSYVVPANPEVEETIYWNGNVIDAKKFAHRTPKVEKVQKFLKQQKKQELQNKYQTLQQQMEQIQNTLEGLE